MVNREWLHHQLFANTLQNLFGYSWEKVADYENAISFELLTKTQSETADFASVPPPGQLGETQASSLILPIRYIM